MWTEKGIVMCVENSGIQPIIVEIVESLGREEESVLSRETI